MKRTAQHLTSSRPSLEPQHPVQNLPRGDLKHQVLCWLLHYPLQRIQDIAVGLDCGERTMARMLQSLMEQQHVDHVTPSLNSGSRHGWYYLTTAGLNLVAELEGGDPVTLARIWRADERHLLRLLPRFHQIVTLQNSIQSLVCSSPVALSYAGSPAEIRSREEQHLLSGSSQQDGKPSFADTIMSVLTNCKSSPAQAQCSHPRKRENSSHCLVSK